MQCIILAGGLGTRIQSIAGKKPKALLPVGSKTFIDWQLIWLKLLGATEVVMALGHSGEEIQNHIEKSQKDPLYPDVHYCYDGPELLGTGGAIRNAAELLQEKFVIAYGDSFLFVDIDDLNDVHMTSKLPVTFSVYENAGVGDQSNVLCRPDGSILYDKFNILPEMRHIDYGLSIVNKNYFMEFNSQKAFDLASFYTMACKKKQVMPYFAKEVFQEVGSPSGYLRFQQMLMTYEYDLKKLYDEKVLRENS